MLPAVPTNMQVDISQRVWSPVIPAVFLALALLAGCTPKKPPPPQVNPDKVRAEQLIKSGDHLGAADLYKGLAARSDMLARQEYLLRAAEQARLGGDRNLQAELLLRLSGLPLNPSRDLRRRLLAADLALADLEPDRALLELGAPPDTSYSRVDRKRYFRMLADVHQALDDELAQAHALIDLESLSLDPLESIALQREILTLLTDLDRPALASQAPDQRAAGWQELAANIKTFNYDAAALHEALLAWRQRHLQHPASPDLLAEYERQVAAASARLDRVAVLLPETGRYAKVSAAIREGLMLAWSAAPIQERINLTFYDLGQPGDTLTLYNQALADGAQAVIGPLRKESVEQLAYAEHLPVTVLALNQTDLDEVPDQLFQFSLSPEGEAREIADRAWSDGLRRPALLRPNDNWGERTAAAFAQRWAELGGTIASAQLYEPGEHDFSVVIRGLLQLDESIAKYQKLLRTKPRDEIDFIPEPGLDTDFIVMLAKSAKARELRPQLLFNYAGDLPVYATSHAWPGNLANNLGEDLRGLRIPEIPWLASAPSTDDPLDHAMLTERLPELKTPLAKLYAMGMDAYGLVTRVRRMAANPGEGFAGRTGLVRAEPGGHFHRQLTWLEIERTGTVALERVPRQGQTDALIANP